jgi:O-antigen/teichoic acid export membrane protein
MRVFQGNFWLGLRDTKQRLVPQPLKVSKLVLYFTSRVKPGHLRLWTLFAILCCVTRSWAATADSKRCQIFFRGTDSLIRERLSIDPGTSFVDLQHAQVALIQNDLWMPVPELNLLKERVAGGMGLVLILGPNTPSASISALTDGAVTQIGTVQDAPADSDEALERHAAIIHYVGPRKDRLARSINWRSATRVQDRTVLKPEHTRVLLATTRRDPISPSAPILLRLRIGKGLVYILSAWLQEGDQTARRTSYAKLLTGVSGFQNYDLQRWPYFNYLLYSLTRDAAGIEPATYRAWAFAPVPHPHDAVAIAIAFLGLLLIAAALFTSVRRYSLSHPDLLDHFSLGRALGEGAPAGGVPLHAGWSMIGKADPRWQTVGFHRPLSGFLYNYILSLGVMIPLGLIVTFYIEMNYVNPFVEARGEWTIVGQFMQVFFVLLDLGTTQAMVKYFAEYRISDPRRAVTFVQLAVWFHVLVGILEIGVLALIASTLMPRTTLAFLSWIVILHSIIQFPGLVLIFRDLFRALQRYDFSIFLILIAYVLNPLVQMVCGIFGRRWGLTHPVFGEGMGVVFGFAVGSFLAHSLLIGISALFCSGVGLKLRTIFCAHFDRSTIVSAGSFGLKLSAGRAIAALGTAIVPFLVGRRLDDFLELNELFVIVFGLTFGYLGASAFIFSNVMPSISESLAAGRLALTRRYIDQGLRWGLIMMAMLGGAFVAFSDIFIRGLLPHQFARALGVLALTHLWRLVDFSARLPEEVFQASGRTGLVAWALVIEHVSRLVVVGLLLAGFGFSGLFYALILSSLIKSIFAWLAMIRSVIKPVISWWQTIANPLLTALVNYLLLRAMVLWMWSGPGHSWNTAATVLLVLLCSLPICMFVSGFLGWDDTSLREFRDAVDLVPAPFDFIARFALGMLLLGSGLSPFENRFPAKLGAEATIEATLITPAESELR